jgi:hypothetical protein
MDIKKVADYYRRKNENENEVKLQKLQEDLVAEYSEKFTMKSLLRGGLHAGVIFGTLVLAFRYGKYIPGFHGDDGQASMRGLAYITVVSVILYMFLVRAF